MKKMLKDTLVTTLVVGSFLFGAASLAREVSRPWPVPQTVAEQLQQKQEPCAGTYIITARN